MPDRKTRAVRRAQQTAEVEASQAEMRKSIAETERLVGESEKMLRRHRQELDDDEGDREARRRPAAEPKPGKRS